MTLIPSINAVAKPQAAVQNPPSTAASAAAMSARRVGETTQTASRIPPVTAAAKGETAPQARAGADGQAELEAVRQNEDAARRQTLMRELLSTIPVPPDAIPQLGGEVESLRALQEKSAPNAETKAEVMPDDD